MWRALRRWWHGRTDSPGALGERLAARWLRRRGFRILHRNYRIGTAEADVIALDPDGLTIVIVEVKTRQAADTAPEERINREKQLALSRLAAALLRSRRHAGRPVRFDSVAVILGDAEHPAIRHVRGAFPSAY